MRPVRPTDVLRPGLRSRRTLVSGDILDITDRDQQVVIHTADPGSPSEEALRLPAVIGTQRLDVAR